VFPPDRPCPLPREQESPRLRKLFGRTSGCHDRIAAPVEAGATNGIQARLTFAFAALTILHCLP
jgi:hypothetical protein